MKETNIRQRLDQIGEIAEKLDPGAVDEVMNAMTAVEKEIPGALDREKIAEWCSNEFFSRTQGRVLQYPKDVYRQRLHAVAELLEHPLLLIHIMGTIANRFNASGADPLNDFDELIGLMMAERQEAQG